MLSALAGRTQVRSGVAGYAIGEERTVVDVYRGPARGHVASVARIRCRNVRGGFAIHRQSGSVAIRARQRGLRMVE